MLLAALLTILVALGAATLPSNAAADVLSEESVTSRLTEEERAKFEAIARELQEAAARGAQDPRAQAEAAQIARRADAIANEKMAAEREKVLRFLGVDPESEHAVYVFVSWSMPLELLRAYAIEAMWTGSTLVFRGVPPNRTLGEFFLQDLRQLVWGKGASAAISIDPRLYDSYSVEVVPTIVLTRTRDNFTCVGAGERTVTEGEFTSSFPLCPPIDNNLYLKLSGAVTLDYALEAFHREGWPEAEVYLSALRRGYGVGQTAPKEQQPYTGDWVNVFTPQDLMDQQAAQ